MKYKHRDTDYAAKILVCDECEITTYYRCTCGYEHVAHMEDHPRTCSRPGNRHVTFGEYCTIVNERQAEAMFPTRPGLSEQYKKKPHPRAKLTWEKVREIRKRHDNGEKALDLAREFGVHSSQINLIVRNSSWIEE